MKRFEVRETGRYDYTARLVDPGNAGAAIPGSALATLTLTLYNADTRAGAIVGARNKQNVLNTNDVTVDGTGLLTWHIQPADLAIQNARRFFEQHVALFEFTHTNGAGSHAVALSVENVRRRP